jgi:RNA-directed DNA polymerase
VSVDKHNGSILWKWATYSHANKPKSWVFARYFDKFNKSRQDRWVFGDRHSGAYMHRFSWTRILRHRMVRHEALPDDPALTDYWVSRRRKAPLPINKTTHELIDAQDGRCAICGGFLFAIEDRPQNPREWEKWLATPRRTINAIATRDPSTPAEKAALRLIHIDCRKGNGTTLHNA